MTRHPILRGLWVGIAPNSLRADKSRARMRGKGADARQGSPWRGQAQVMNLCVIRAGAVGEYSYAFRIAATAYASGAIGVNHTLERNRAEGASGHCHRRHSPKQTRGHPVRFGRPMFISARGWLSGIRSGQDVRAPGALSARALGLKLWPRPRRAGNRNRYASASSSSSSS